MSGLNYEPFAAVTFVVSVATIYAATKNVWRRSRVVDYLGDISYPLYLFQIPTYILAFAAFGVTGNLPLLASAIAVSIVAYEAIDVRLKPLLFSLNLKSFVGLRRSVQGQTVTPTER
jgi:peptidoglycan/LPS O-acetylase OafA/YrhL